MNINEFTQKPLPGHTYAKNEVPAFIISTANTLLAILKIGNEVVFKGSYAPDFNNQIKIDFSGLYDSYLRTIIPTSAADEITHTEYRQEFTAIFDVLEGEDTAGDPATTSWKVANARLKSSSAFSLWCRSNFLTNQPLEKTTNYESPEWLTWLEMSGASTLVARFYTKAGNELDVEVCTTTGEGCYSANVCYSRLIRMANVLPSQLQGYYDLILYDLKDVEVCRQRYIYEERTAREKYFCFVNALGGIDTLICQGENVLQPETTHNIGRFGGQYRALDDTDDLRKWSQDTGLMPTMYRNWVYELLAQKQGAEKYDPAANDYYEIIVDSSDIAMSDHGQLTSATFGYILTEPVNVMFDTERAVDRQLHQSVAEQAEDMEDLTTAVVVTFEDDGQGNYETDELELSATLIYVTDTRAVTTAGEPLVYYYLNGSSTAAGSFQPSSTPYAITKELTDTIQFATQNGSLGSLTINYYLITNQQ